MAEAEWKQINASLRAAELKHAAKRARRYNRNYERQQMAAAADAIEFIQGHDWDWQDVLDSAAEYEK